jgi:DNA polymerase-4
MSSEQTKYWSRAIILVDMNAFFASIEQHDFAFLRGQPVVVTNGMQGTCIITSSYEARAYGIKTGMRLREAQARCPQVIQRAARPHRYAEISRRIMHSLHDITPDIEIFSVDEAFLDITHCQQFWGEPEYIAHLVQKKVHDVSGLSCSVGLSGDKTTAKYAAEVKKPNGLVVIPPWEAKARLQDVPVTELCGIGVGVGHFLAQYGVYTCGDMEKLPISILSQRFGNLGRRMWLMCQGMDPEPLCTNVAPPKSMGHGKVTPPNTCDPDVIRTYLQHMSEKLAARLRRHNLYAQQFFIGLRHYERGWIGDTVRLILPTQDGQKIYQLCLQVMNTRWQGEPIWQVQVTALRPSAQGQQLDLFMQPDHNSVPRLTVIDQINQRYGELTLAPARLLNRSSMPNVIAPAWKPEGHRQSV